MRAAGRDSGAVRGIYRRLLARYGRQKWWPADTPFEVIVGAILTQNTAWANVERAIAALKKRRLLTPRGVCRVPVSSLASVIRPAGYFNVKARRLKNFIRFLDREYGGSLPALLAEPAPVLRQKLLGVNGIGNETADCIVLYAAGKPSFVVDAYTKRLFSRYGLLRADADYAAVQRMFTESLPQSARLFNEYHALIVEHSKRACSARPLCGQCILRAECRWFSVNR
ncbi:MAG TPA: endonuclease III domain-containing protein [Candidatus Eisenbacteria bacterium]|nr:endonuclease III domain-containing protein [Candidatus Eisenbacteria bacterium]